MILGAKSLSAAELWAKVAGEGVALEALDGLSVAVHPIEISAALATPGDRVDHRRAPASVRMPDVQPVLCTKFGRADAALNAVLIDQHMADAGLGVPGECLPASKGIGGGLAEATLGEFALGNAFELLMQPLHGDGHHNAVPSHTKFRTLPSCVMQYTST